MNLFKLLGTIAVENADAVKAIDETTKKGEKSESKLSGAFSKIGKASVACGKVVASGLAVAATAISTLSVKALNLAGELEQNMGGSEAVFGEYAEKMQKTAAEAFENMGLSQSDYLATANKMGALFKGAGFEMDEASQLTADAMQRAADVASIMGIDVSAAMESVAGAAKGNFTMMDNLGVAMNDTTIQAYALSKGIEKTTQDMTTQEKIGLAMEMFLEKTEYATGNYARENDTLAGALTTAKAALSNFLSGAGDAESVIDSATNAVEIIVDNLNEIVPKLTSGIVKIIKKIAPRVAKEASSAVESVLPDIIDAAIVVFEGLVEGDFIDALVDTIPIFVDGIIRIVETIADKLPDILKKLLPALSRGVAELVKGVVEAVFSSLPEILGAVITATIDSLGEIFDVFFDNVYDDMYGISDATQAIISQADAANEAVREAKEAHAENAASINWEAERTRVLWEELQTLVDENGKVKEGYEDRAGYITNQLAEATGLEIEMVDGQIAAYDELAKSIENTIKMKQAEALIKSNQEAADAASVALEESKAAMTKTGQELSEAKAEQNRLNAEYQTFVMNHRSLLSGKYRKPTGEWNQAVLEAADMYDLAMQYDALRDSIDKAALAVENCEREYEEAVDSYAQNSDEVRINEEAMTSFYAGNYDTTIALLSQGSDEYYKYVAKIRSLNREELDAFKQEVDDAYAFYELVRAEHEAGNAAFSAEMVESAKKTADDLAEAYRDAQSEFYKIGSNMAKGIKAGMEDEAETLYTSAGAVTNGILSRMKITAQIKSPSRITQKFGEFITRGLAVGLKDGEEEAVSAAKSVMDNTLRTFGSGEMDAGINATIFKPNDVAEESTISTISAQQRETMKESFDSFVEALPDIMLEAFSNMRFDISNREFARLVKAVN